VEAAIRAKRGVPSLHPKAPLVAVAAAAGGSGGAEPVQGTAAIASVVRKR
jgi:hypothetical protein